MAAEEDPRYQGSYGSRSHDSLCFSTRSQCTLRTSCRDVRKACLELLCGLVTIAKAEPNRLEETLGPSIQRILWRLSECLLEERVEGMDAPTLASELVGMVKLVVLHAPAALQPFLAVCQPLPSSECCCCSCCTGVLYIKGCPVYMVGPYCRKCRVRRIVPHAAPGLETVASEMAKHRHSRSLAADLVSFATWCGTILLGTTRVASMLRC